MDIVEAEIREKNLHQKKKRSLQSHFSCQLFTGHGLTHQAWDGDWGFWAHIPGVCHLHRCLKPPATLPPPHTSTEPPTAASGGAGSPRMGSCFPSLELAGVRQSFPATCTIRALLTASPLLHTTTDPCCNEKSHLAGLFYYAIAVDGVR